MTNSGNMLDVVFLGAERKQVTGFCEYGNETLDFMKDGEFVSS